MVSLWCVERVLWVRESSAGGLVMRPRKRHRCGRTIERRFCFADSKIARLLECAERFVDARDGELVGCNVEVSDGVVDKGRWVFVEQHFEVFRVL